MTASGLLAGAVCVVQRLRDSREVDIYRTVVKLKRCRHEFITSVVSWGGRRPKILTKIFVTALLLVTIIYAESRFC